MAKTWTDYRPISLCNVLNKIITKVLMDRLSPFLPQVISPNQSGYVKGWLLNNNALLAQEMFHELARCSLAPNVAVKIDMAKAYDRVQWPFLLKTLGRRRRRRLLHCIFLHIGTLIQRSCQSIIGISRDSMHKRRATGGKKKAWRKKRKYELGRQPANTKLLSNKSVRRVRVRGGNVKWRTLRLDTGNYSWGSEAVNRKTRILDMVYNASKNELVRTQTLVKGAIVQVDAAPFKQWYLQHYGVEIGRKKKAAAKKEGEEITEADAAEEVKKSNHVQRKLEKRQQDRKIDAHIEEQFGGGRLLAAIASRPGQCGRCDGYILEGKELE
ncbi:40S ribosomal protein S8-like, partial [Salvia splendens]|uniref:40S ribosomal protein S8-like n=1 Tax=Salvia splendens TaxID=180675 RepID=UPI001C278DB5